MTKRNFTILCNQACDRHCLAPEQKKNVRELALQWFEREKKNMDHVGPLPEFMMTLTGTFCQELGYL